MTGQSPDSAQGVEGHRRPQVWRCLECGGLYDSTADLHRDDLAWDMPAECGPCGGLEMEVAYDLPHRQSQDQPGTAA